METKLCDKVVLDFYDLSESQKAIVKDLFWYYPQIEPLEKEIDAPELEKRVLSTLLRFQDRLVLSRIT